MSGILAITDGDKRVNWLSPRRVGIYCKKWNPGRLEMKGGGVYHDSPIADGRILTDYRWANIVDSFTFTHSGDCQDDPIWFSQETDRLLIQAVDFWKRKNNKPVWIESRGSQETNTKYAIIHSFKLPDDNNPYQEPFATWLGEGSVEYDLVLAVEHGPWMEYPPGQGEATPMGVMYSVNYAINGSFEEWTAGVPDGWTAVGGPTLTETTDYNYVYHGSTSCKIVSGGALAGIKYTDIPVGYSQYGIVKITAKVYLVDGEAFLYSGATPDPTITYQSYDSTTITGRWITLTLWKQPFTANLSVLVGVSGATGEAYFDDVRVERFYGNVDQTDNRVQPLLSADDAEALDAPATSLSLTANPMTVGWNNGAGDEYNVGIRFRNVPIPQGTTIRSAWLELQSFSYTGSPITMTIDGEDADDSAVFSTRANYDARPRTTASVSWSHTQSAGTIVIESPDISSVVQEIVDRAGWVSGNNLTIFINDNNVHALVSRYITIHSFDDTSVPPPTLFFVLDQQTEANNFVVAETTDPTYVANKQNDANITHIFRHAFSLGTWSTNLMESPLPYDLLVGGDDDATYFGIQDNDSGGPFASIVFNTDMQRVGAAQLIWEYYNGATWATLPNYKDWTSAGTGPFTDSGLISLHFDPPSTWAPASLFTLFGGTAPAVTAWWIRIRQNDATPITVSPQQIEFDPYTVTWPYAEIQGDIVGGEIPAIAEGIINNLSDGATATARMAAYKRMMVGTRRVSRGEEFRAYLNCSDVQVPSFMQIALADDGAIGDAQFIDYNAAPTGRCVEFDSAGGGTGTASIEITINRTQAEQFFGKFRIYLRVNEDSGGAPVVNSSVLFNYGKETQTLRTSTLHTANDFSVLDFGEMVIPGIWWVESDIFNDLVITINVNSDAVVGSFKIYDLILFPVDEVVVDMYEDPTYPQYIGGTSGSFTHNEAFTDWTELVVDSIRDPRKHIRSYLRSEPDKFRYRSYIHEENSNFALIPNERLRLWFMGWTHPTEGTPAAYSHPSGAHSFLLNHNSRYTGMRGRR